jgi:hypothetical protein
MPVDALADQTEAVLLAAQQMPVILTREQAPAAAVISIAFLECAIAAIQRARVATANYIPPEILADICAAYPTDKEIRTGVWAHARS